MTDTQKMLRIYSGDRTILVMGSLAAVATGLAIRRSDLSALGMFALGWSIYVVEEYLVHRFIFHAPAPKRQALFDVLYRLHYGHHDQVRNRDLLFTPLWFALSLTLANSAVSLLLFSPENVVIGAFGGGVCAYLLFEWLHLTSHFRTSSKGRLGRYITRRHGKHHQIDYDHWYTVSPGGQLVDKAFGSDPVEYSVVPNVRTCGLDPDDPRILKSRIRFGSDASLANLPATAGHLDLGRAV